MAELLARQGETLVQATAPPPGSRSGGAGLLADLARQPEVVTWRSWAKAISGARPAARRDVAPGRGQERGPGWTWRQRSSGSASPGPDRRQVNARHLSQAQQADLRRAVGTSAVIRQDGATAPGPRQLRAANQALGQAQSYAQHVGRALNGLISVDRQAGWSPSTGGSRSAGVRGAGGALLLRTGGPGDRRLEPTMSGGSGFEKEMLRFPSGKKVEVS